MEKSCAYIDALRLGPILQGAASCLRREQRQFLSTEVRMLTTAIREETREFASLRIRDNRTGTFAEGAHIVQIDLDKLDDPQNSMVITLLSGATALQNYVIDIDKEVMGGAGLRILTGRIWDHIARHQLNARSGNSLDVDIHKSFDEARQRYHDEAILRIEFSMASSDQDFQIIAPPSLYKRLASLFFLAAPYLLTPHSDRPIVNPLFINPVPAA